MSPTEITTILTTLQGVLTTFESVGVPALIAMIIAGPVFLVGLVLFMNHLANIRSEKIQSASNERNEKSQMAFREWGNSLIEAYRIDTHHIIQEIGAKHSDMTDKHKTALGTIKTLEVYSGTLETVVSKNTQAIERLAAAIDKRM